MTQETCKQGLQVERLDYSRRPPGYGEHPWSRTHYLAEINAIAAACAGAGGKFAHACVDENKATIVATLDVGEAEALAAAWAHYKAANDPPGMVVQQCMCGTSYEAMQLEPRGHAEARAAAWAWHDRRHALMRMFEQAAEIVDSVAIGLDHEVPTWPDLLTWSDEAVASAEREVAAMIHRHAEKRVEEVLRG